MSPAVLKNLENLLGSPVMCISNPSFKYPYFGHYLRCNWLLCYGYFWAKLFTASAQDWLLPPTLWPQDRSHNLPLCCFAPSVVEEFSLNSPQDIRSQNIQEVDQILMKFRAMNGKGNTENESMLHPLQEEARHS